MNSGALEHPLKTLTMIPWSQLSAESIMVRNIAQKHTDPIGTSAPRSESQSLSGSKVPSQASEDSGGRRPGVAFISLLSGVKEKQLWTLGAP